MQRISYSIEKKIEGKWSFVWRRTWMRENVFERLGILAKDGGEYRVIEETVTRTLRVIDLEDMQL